MDKLVRSIKFPFSFNVERLKIDLKKIMTTDWVDHYNQNDYSGKWTSVALMSQNGKSNSIYALPTTDEKLIATDALSSCFYFKEILDGFLFEKTTVRLLQLAVGAEIKPHSDHELGYENGCFRLHIPIITNSGVEFILDGKRLIMNEGECWYIDANFIHSVTNKGTQDRIHLVVDGIRNEWTDKMFYSEANIDSFVKPLPVISEDQKQLMIAELQKMNTPASIKMIEELQK